MKRIPAKLLLIVLAVLALAACSNGTPAQPVEITGGVSPDASAPAQTGGETDSAAEPGAGAVAPTADPNLPPEDVPIMEGATNVAVARAGTQINYRIVTDVETVIAFYQEQLAAYGWEETRAPDTAIGAMGSMSRTHPNGDKLTINLSYNVNDSTTTVTISILRVK